MSAIELVSVIREFVPIQELLIGELKKSLGQRDWRLMIGVPRAGEVEALGLRWRYRVHGTGVRFSRGRRVVDVDRGLDGDPRRFSAGSLAAYLAATGRSQVAWRGRDICFDYESGPSILRAMSKEGAIVPVESDLGALYLLRPDA